MFVTEVFSTAYIVPVVKQKEKEWDSNMSRDFDVVRQAGAKYTVEDLENDFTYYTCTNITI